MPAFMSSIASCTTSGIAMRPPDWLVRSRITAMVTVAVGPDELDPQPAASATSNDGSEARRGNGRGIKSSLRTRTWQPVDRRMASADRVVHLSTLRVVGPLRAGLEVTVSLRVQNLL